MKTGMRLRWPSGGGVCRAEHNGKKCQKLWKGEVLPLDGSLLMGDSSDASSQRAFIDIYGQCLMKAHIPHPVFWVSKVFCGAPSHVTSSSHKASFPRSWLCLFLTS